MENIKKIVEHTYGTHIFMKLSIDGKEYAVDCYLRDDGEHFKTSADGTEKELLQLLMSYIETEGSYNNDKSGKSH